MAELSDLKKYLLNMPDQELAILFGLQPKRIGRDGSTKQSEKWFDRPISGLNKEGQALLKELEMRLADPNTESQVDRKHVRYLRSLKKMHFKVPLIFRQSIAPKQLYNHLSSFCFENDIPETIVSKMVPALVAYIESGHMRPIIFVGEKGCGKTTAVRLLVEQALQIPTQIIKVPQMDGSHGLTGFCGSYRSADAGMLAKGRLSHNSLLVAYIFDEIDKVPQNVSCASIDEELLSVTDESNNSIYDNYLEATLVGLENCPMFFTANDLNKISPVLADRCTVIHFPNPTSARIKSILTKYTTQKMQCSLFQNIDFNYDLVAASVDRLVHKNITSLRQYQQLVENVLDSALDTLFKQEKDGKVFVTEDMFQKAEEEILGSAKPQIGF